LRFFEEDIRKAGGIDLQILGIGRNGHIGFNEPTSKPGSRTRLKVLSQETMDDNAKSFCAGRGAPALAPSPWASARFWKHGKSFCWRRAPGESGRGGKIH